MTTNGSTREDAQIVLIGEEIMNKLKGIVWDIRYKRVCAGHRYAKNGSGRYLETSEVEEIITRKIGWYAEVLSGGGTCNIQQHYSTKVFGSEEDAMGAGLLLPTNDPWKPIDE